VDVISVAVRVSLLPTSLGGRSTAVRTGYRPLCTVTTGGDPVEFGLCELHGFEEAQPGTTTDAFLTIDRGVGALVLSRLTVGTRLVLSEGSRVVGDATIVAE
jgi:hypothetical protein